MGVPNRDRETPDRVAELQREVKSLNRFVAFVAAVAALAFVFGLVAVLVLDRHGW